MVAGGSLSAAGQRGGADNRHLDWFGQTGLACSLAVESTGAGQRALGCPWLCIAAIQVDSSWIVGAFLASIQLVGARLGYRWG